MALSSSVSAQTVPERDVFGDARRTLPRFSIQDLQDGAVQGSNVAVGPQRCLVIPVVSASNVGDARHLTGADYTAVTDKFAPVRDFWLENSYDQLDISFDVLDRVFALPEENTGYSNPGYVIPSLTTGDIVFSPTITHAVVTSFCHTRRLRVLRCGRSAFPLPRGPMPPMLSRRAFKMGSTPDFRGDLKSRELDVLHRQLAARGLESPSRVPLLMKELRLIST